MELSPLWITLKVALTSSAIVFVLGLAAAWGVTNMRRGKAVADALFSLPLVLPPTVAGFLILIMFGARSTIGRMLDSMGIRLIFTWQGAAVAAAIVSFPVMYRGARGALEQVDKNVIYAARTLGMREPSIFLRVMVPMARPGIIASLILSFARSLGEFGATMMVAGNIPGRTRTMSVAVYTAMQSGDRDLAYKWVAIIMVYSFIILFIMESVISVRRNK